LTRKGASRQQLGLQRPATAIKEPGMRRPISDAYIERWNDGVLLRCLGRWFDYSKRHQHLGRWRLGYLSGQRLAKGCCIGLERFQHADRDRFDRLYVCQRRKRCNGFCDDSKCRADQQLGHDWIN